MKIKSSIFYKSSSNPDELPQTNKPEIAFIGRSNVGKSSLINMLVQKKNLAKTSGKPGKTQLINHFLIDNKWFLIDLPGYGYTNLSKSAKSKIISVINDFFIQNKKLVLTFLLIDIRHEPLKIDLEFMMWLKGLKVKFVLIFTKSDKINHKFCEEKVKFYLEKLQIKIKPKALISSSLSRFGREEILREIGKKIQFGGD
ncbi:MAG: YihA family ribosome biogenesis GTP-binding protein [Flavobacteriaceae bacterium]|nr:YihA family ribosome biogenesis GTP-binding protein [Flavobacteriaceae bacterium]